MFIRIKLKPNGKKAVQIVESVRRADKIRQKIIRHLGQAENDSELQVLKNLAGAIIEQMEQQRQPSLSLYDGSTVLTANPDKAPSDDKVSIRGLREEQRVIEGIGDVFGKLYTDLGLGDIISGSRKDSQWNAVLKTCVLARLANPASKLRTASLLEQDYGIRLPLEKIYRMMDCLAVCESSVKSRIAETTRSLFPDKVDVLFFDVTTLYFENFTPDGLREFGFSKDRKFRETQVVLALVTTIEGLPVTYRLFPGNMYEGNTLVKMVEELRVEHQIENILLVADRAMFTRRNLDNMDAMGVKYIVAAKLKSLKKAVREEILSKSGEACEISGEPHYVSEYSLEGRRLVVSYNARRASKDAADRKRLVERLLKRVRDGKLKVCDLISNAGTKKYVVVSGDSVARVNEEKIAMDARWDGLHGLITNVTDRNPAEIIERYRNLWQIEEAFRVNKHDLRMRPVYHWTPERIHAHIAICFLAFTLAKQAVYRYSIQQSSMSFEQMRNELLHAQVSVVREISSGRRFAIPSNVTLNQEKIYRAFGLKRSAVPYPLDKQ